MEPQSIFDSISSKPEVIGQAYSQHVKQSRNEIARNVGSVTTENGLECKSEQKWLVLKCHGDNYLLASTPDGILFLFDSHSGKICWSIPSGDPLHVSYESVENNCSYIVFRGSSRRVYKHTKDSEPVDLKCHASELVAKPYEYLDGVIVPKKSETVLHVNLRTGRLSPLTSEATTDFSSDEILCIMRFDYQLTCYKPGTNTVSWYRRVACFNISIVNRDGAMLHEKNDVPARQGQYLLTPGTVSNISWHGEGTDEDGNTVQVAEYKLPIVVIHIEKGQSADDAVKNEVRIIKDVCNGNLNLLDVFDVVSDKDFHKVSTEHCNTSLRQFMQSTGRDHKIMLKLIRGIVTGLVGLHDKEIFLGNLDISDIFVDNHFNAKISVISKNTRFPLISSSNGAKDMLALGRIIFFCFTGKEYNNEHMFRPKPSLVHLNPIYDCPDALDLLRKLLDKNPLQRATALQASNHTLFWSPSKNLQFIRAVTERLELKERRLLTAINSINEAVFRQRWNKYLPTDFIDVMEDGSYGDVMEDGSYRKHIYYYDSMYDLLRIIRHLQAHERGIRNQISKKKRLHPEVREIFGPAGFESYFRKKFPNLVNEVYNAMKKHLGEEPNFLEYYKQTPM